MTAKLVLTGYMLQEEIIPSQQFKSGTGALSNTWGPGVQLQCFGLIHRV